jgi:ankyrin repeat protein
MRVRIQMFVFLLIAASFACGHGSTDGRLVDAAAEGDAATVQKLLDGGANVDAHARDDWTPLTSAAREGKLDVVKLLLKRGANVNAKEGGGHTAVFWAKKYQHHDVEQALIDAGGRDL